MLVHWWGTIWGVHWAQPAWETESLFIEFSKTWSCRLPCGALQSDPLVMLLPSNSYELQESMQPEHVSFSLENRTLEWFSLEFHGFHGTKEVPHTPAKHKSDHMTRFESSWIPLMTNWVRNQTDLDLKSHHAKPLGSKSFPKKLEGLVTAAQLIMWVIS